jgi:hypothetical protein
MVQSLNCDESVNQILRAYVGSDSGRSVRHRHRDVALVSSEQGPSIPGSFPHAGDPARDHEKQLRGSARDHWRRARRAGESCGRQDTSERDGRACGADFLQTRLELSDRFGNSTNPIPAAFQARAQAR